MFFNPENTLTLESLPHDVIGTILLRISDPEQIRNCALVSTKWASVIRNSKPLQKLRCFYPLFYSYLPLEHSQVIQLISKENSVSKKFEKDLEAFYADPIKV